MFGIKWRYDNALLYYLKRILSRRNNNYVDDDLWRERDWNKRNYENENNKIEFSQETTFHVLNSFYHKYGSCEIETIPLKISSIKSDLSIWIFFLKSSQVFQSLHMESKFQKTTKWEFIAKWIFYMNWKMVKSKIKSWTR